MLIKVQLLWYAPTTKSPGRGGGAGGRCRVQMLLFCLLLSYDHSYDEVCFGTQCLLLFYFIGLEGTTAFFKLALSIPIVDYNVSGINNYWMFTHQQILASKTSQQHFHAKRLFHWLWYLIALFVGTTVTLHSKLVSVTQLWTWKCHIWLCCILLAEKIFIFC